MSIKTTNYELIKPELTDSADITATNSNWDKIDEELKKAETHKHTAEDVGALPIGGGILEGDLTLDVQSYPMLKLKSQNDAQEALVTLLPSSKFLEFTNRNTNRKGLTLSLGNHTNSIPQYLKLRLDPDSGESKEFMIYGEHNKDSMPFFPNTGGTLNGHEIYLHNGYGLVRRSAKSAVAMFGSLDNPNVLTDGRVIQVFSGNKDIKDSLVFSDVVNEQWVNYKVYGEHNITCGTSAPSSLANGCIYQQY